MYKFDTPCSKALFFRLTYTISKNSSASDVTHALDHERLTAFSALFLSMCPFCWARGAKSWMREQLFLNHFPKRLLRGTMSWTSMVDFHHSQWCSMLQQIGLSSAFRTRKFICFCTLNVYLFSTKLTTVFISCQNEFGVFVKIFMFLLIFANCQENHHMTSWRKSYAPPNMKKKTSWSWLRTKNQQKPTFDFDVIPNPTLCTST